jgi:hypothetical protein
LAVVAVPRHIPPSLWARLAALDAACDTRMIRRGTGTGGIWRSGKNYGREWRIEIMVRGGGRLP